MNRRLSQLMPRRGKSSQFSDGLLTSQQKLEVKENEEKLYLRLLKRKSKLQDHRDPLIVLRHRDSILLVLAVTTSIESCRIFLSSSDEEWGMTFILPFTIAYFTFAVPLQMCQLFLGQYGHKSLIKLWEIAPLFYGLGITYVMIVIMAICKVAVKGSVAFLYLSYSFHQSLGYEFCETNNRNFCNASLPKMNLTCDKGVLMYPGHYFYKYKALLHVIDPSDPEGTAGQMATFLAIMWILIFGMSSLNLVKISKVVVFTIVVLLLGGVYGMFRIFEDGKFTGLKFFFFLDKDRLLDYKLWLNSAIIANRVSATELGVHVIFGVMSVNKTPPHYDAITSALVTYVIVLLFAVIGYGLGGILANWYNASIACITVKGWSFHFGMLSEFIRQSEMSHHMVNAVVYGTMSFFLVIFISVLICILSELMLQTFRTFLGYRRYMQATICTLCFIASNSLISQKDNKYMKMCSYGHRYLGILMPAIFCIAVFWIYGIRRILDDFHFAMGSKLPKYWQICWKVTALLVPVCFIFFFIYTFNFKSRTDRYFLLFMISPVIISMIVRIIMTAVKLKLTYLWHSSRTFGPETKQEKIDRRNFIPHLWKRHREKAITCKHKCLVNNPLFKDAVQINEKNRKVFSLSFSSEIEAAFEGSSVDY